jgi:hypothetical protein
MNRFTILTLMFFFSCASKDKYDPLTYYNAQEKDALLTSIISYIFIAPPYTAMTERFKPEHREFYSGLTSKFSLNELYLAADGTHYFFVLRPGPKSDEVRGVGGHFKRGDGFLLKDFREVFVTPLLSATEVKEKGSFLFDKMVGGEMKDYLRMKSYVQWPNEASVYDTVTYEWRLMDSVQ